MESGSAALRQTVRRLRSTGTASVRAVVVKENDGKAKLVEGPRRGYALQLPKFVASPKPPLAIVRVRSKSRNPLSPRARDFSIGADFRLGRVTKGTRMDDGDNLVQRSSYNSPNQYKLQVDDAVPSCRLKGDAGQVLVEANPVRRLRWFRALCVRTGDTVTLKVWRIKKGGLKLRATVSKTETIGSIHHPRKVPLTVGGRLRDNGTMPLRDTDQFNGRVDRVIYDRR